jgi:hypothetical protein
VTEAPRIAIVVAAALVLVGGFVLAQGAGEDDDPVTAGPAQSVAPATAPRTGTTATAPPPRVETIRIRDRAPAGDVRTLTYDSGDTARLRFRSNVAEEVHIHGYDRYVDVPANGTATTRFTADAEGIFEVESHGSGELLARLEIRP